MTHPVPGTFTSNLSVAEFAAVRSVGFSPVSLVEGTAAVGSVHPSCGHYSQCTAVPVKTWADRQEAVTGSEPPRRNGCADHRTATPQLVLGLDN